MNGESNAGNAVIGVSVGGGLIATINEYAVVISLSLTLLGLLIGLTFHILAVRDRRKKMRSGQSAYDRIRYLEKQLAKLEKREH
jgi:hypothetical protein